MEIKKIKIKGSFIINIKRLGDSRGYFSRIFCKKEFKKYNISNEISQVNCSYSKKKGTIRGMHYQIKPHSEMKIIMCTKGIIFDVVLDLRKKSKKYKKWFGIKLDSKEKNMLVVPEGCAHGFQTLQKDCEIMYLVSKAYNPKSERGVRWNDSNFKIKWPLKPTEISKKDLSWNDYDYYK